MSIATADRPPITRKDGYRLIWAPDHPDAHSGRVYEHRLVAEQKIGRRLTRHDIVHHLNEDRSDNRPENLEVLSKAAHQFHHLGRSGMSNVDIANRIREGWTYAQFIAVGVYQHRVSRIKRIIEGIRCDYRGAFNCAEHRELYDLEQALFNGPPSTTSKQE